MPAGWGDHRETVRRQACVLLEAQERIAPSNGEESTYELRQMHPNIVEIRIDIVQSVIRSVQAEVNTKRQHKLNDPRARLPQFQHGAPQHIGQDQTHEVKILRQLEDVKGEHPVLRLVDHAVGKKSCSSQQKHRESPDVCRRSQFFKHERVQTHQGKIKADRQDGVGIVVEISVFHRSKTAARQNYIASYACCQGRHHVQIQSEISPEGATKERAHHHPRLQKSAEDPDGIIKWTRHVPPYFVPWPVPSASHLNSRGRGLLTDLPGLSFARRRDSPTICHYNGATIVGRYNGLQAHCPCQDEHGQEQNSNFT